MYDILSTIIPKLRGLKAFPKVAMKVLQLGNPDQLIPDDLVDVIRSDPGITGKVLKLANSSYYGLEVEIASLKEACNLLGVKPLISLVLTSCTKNYMETSGDGNDAYEEAASTAIAARLIASASKATDPERAYTAGLLQNLGSVVVAQHVPKQYVAEIASLRAQGTPRHEAEKLVLGLHHAEIGARLAARWNFPEVLVDSIRYHDRPESSTVDQALCRVGHLAEVMTRLTGVVEDSGKTPLSLRSLEEIGLRADDFGGLREPFMEELGRARSMLTGA